jgi:hypothetical protein
MKALLETTKADQLEEILSMTHEDLISLLKEANEK